MPAEQKKVKSLADYEKILEVQDSSNDEDEDIKFNAEDVNSNGEVKISFSREIKDLDYFEGIDKDIISSKIFFNVAY